MDVKRIVIKGRLQRWASTLQFAEFLQYRGVDFQDSEGVAVHFNSLNVDARLVATAEAGGDCEFHIVRLRLKKNQLHGYLYAIKSATAPVYYPGGAHEGQFKAIGLTASGFIGQLWTQVGAAGMTMFGMILGCIIWF